jgi:hypothetical protein
MRACLLVAISFLAGTAGAQGTGVSVSGTVYDSLAHRPLGGAVVELASNDSANVHRTVVADSVGRYLIDDVPPGRYVIGFFHPILDSLTLEPIVRQVVVAGDLAVSADLGIPSAARLRSAFCPARGGSVSKGAFVGVVRDSRDGKPLGGAPVVAEWWDMVVGRGTIARAPARRSTTTAANGWFALCDVPTPGVFSVTAASGTDSSDAIEVRMSPDGFMRREVYVGPRVGQGELNGRVSNKQGQPLGDVIVSVSGGARARTNADGEWTLSGLPLGTRMLEVRAIGYYPDRRAVDVVAGAPQVRTALETFENVLDTVRVRAATNRAADEGGFELRRKTIGTGKFLTEDDIRRRNPIETSDLFRSVTGIRLDEAGRTIKMRGAFDDCAPTVFVDGALLPAAMTGSPPTPQVSPDDINAWVNPRDIVGIEIYHDVPPAQFQVGLSGCGSIVIWTRRRAVKKPE